MNSLFPTTETSAWMASLGPIALKGAALLALALLAGASLHRASAARRYVLWLSSLLALGLLTIAVPLLPAWRVLPTRDVPTFEVPASEEREEAAAVVEVPLPLSANTVPLTPVAGSEVATITESSAPFQWPAVSWSDVVAHLPMVWLVIASVLIARLIVSSVRLSRLRRRCSRVEVPFRLNAMLGELTSTSGKAAPTLLIGPADSIPMVWGIVRPWLLLPADAAEWPEEKLRSVLLHEMAHLQRRDPAALLVAQITQALHWFNPLAWLTLRSLRADQEKACDDAVLRQGVRASDYAQHLLDLSQHRRLSPGLGPCALAMARSAPVENRIEAILDSCIKRDASSRRAILCTALCSAAIAVPLAMMANEAAKGLRGRILDRHGVVLAESSKDKVRVYPLKTLAAHVVGYTGKSGPDDPTPDGRAAMEKIQNADLKKGKDVSLSLDARIQSLTTRAVKDSGFERAAVVVLDPRTGEILASVSLPSYDPNRFIPTLAKEDWEFYSKDKSTPLFDRCLHGQYSPGSAFVPFTALAGMASGVGDRHFECTGSVDYGGRSYQCWIGRQKATGHGTLDMKSAIVASCNCYWYQFGNAAGIDAFAKMGRLIGIGEATGVTVDEAKGELPGPEALAAKSGAQDKWTAGHTANLAIGQGTLLTTPLQLAVLAATVCNGGKVPKATLLRLESGAKPEWRADLIAEGLPANQIEQIREGMRLVVNGDTGTGKAARSDTVVIAGKTGTSQFWRSVNGKKEQDNRALFVGFAPFDQPTLAFAVLVEGGKSGGADAAPIAKCIVEESLALPANGSGKLEPVEEPGGERKAAFDAKGDVLKREIQKAAPDSKTGFSLDEITVRNGRVIISGITASMTQALQFREKLTEIGKSHGIEWSFPVPETMADGMRVKFRAAGEVKVGVDKKAAVGSSTSARDHGVGVSESHPDDPLFAFLHKPVEAAAQFHVRMRRTHYFDDDIPDLAAKDGFEIEPAETAERPWYAGFVFVPKTSTLARALVESVPWETTGLQAEVTLKWRKADGKDWVELIEANNIKPMDAAPPKVETRKEGPVLNDAPKLPNKATASKTSAVVPATSSKNTLEVAERRFRLIQGECGMSDLPPDVKLLSSDLAGSISPREVVVRFSGPREAVRLWLAGCSGLRAPAAAAKPADPSLRILEANPLAVMDQWLKRPAIALSDWPSSGSVGRFECMGKSAMCSITVHAPDDDVVNVELRKQARSIKL